MQVQPTSQSSGFEQTLLSVVRSLPTFQRTQLLDFALSLKERMIATSEAMAIAVDENDAQVWARASVRSLAKYWDTPEEDEAWAYLQKAM